CTVNCECDRYLEIWNLVFMQFDRKPDGSLVPLPRPSVDTGMGLERLATAVQGHHSNYDTDLFMPIIEALAADSGVPYSRDAGGTPHRVCADHLRGLVFTIADGGMPGNEGAGYVLRRILRRAARLGKKLGYDGPFLYRFVDRVIEIMVAAYPELKRRRDHVVHVIESEETRFAETLDAGLARFEEARKQAVNGVIPGVEAFKLYDTFGFPLDLTEVLAHEAGLTVDVDGFATALAGQRERSLAQTAFKDQTVAIAGGLDLESQFTYETTEVDATLLWASDDGTALVLDRTPFYAEAGGQINDEGCITSGDGLRFRVERVDRVDQKIVHHGQAEKGSAADWIGKRVRAEVDLPRRRMIQRNHTATHLLHKALRTVLGDHVHQSGSLVAPDRLRFDFSHTGPMTPDQIREVEEIVNHEILSNTPVAAHEEDYDKAIAAGVTALFGETYGDRVRVVKIGEYSAELCGGTHVRTTGEIGLFRITSETGVAAGVRRIEAITGKAAVTQARDDAATVVRAATMLKTSSDKVLDRVESTLSELRDLRNELTQLRRKLAAGGTQSIPRETLDDLGITLIYHCLSDGSAEDAAAIADEAKRQSDATVAFIATASGHIVSAASPSAVKRGIKAGDLLREVARRLNGGGGGRPDFAKGKVASLDNWDEAKPFLIEKIRAMVGA
ncbi:MAG TPA: alanine--tRNA ligase, partial [Acidobacteriota bacterium]|nr:alanine--tRNA ligase [Acidobacteriota bacterium]